LEGQQSCFVAEIGESLQGGDLNGAGVGEKNEMGVIGYFEAMQDAKSCYHTMGISYGGDEKCFLDLLTLIDEGQCISAPKPKGSRQVKNLECSINFDATGVRSSQSKGKRAFAVL
jgi:hypothetical protein